MINLDAADSADLWAFWQAHHAANRSSRMLLCGNTGRGTKKWTQALANYACNKSVAMKLRATGEIERAKTYELICERIYQDLPKALRW
jgi:hypothetical protein